MRPPPSNRNVPDWIWNQAMRQHQEYLAAHARLRQAGLDETAADAYIDAMELLDKNIGLLDPMEVDFVVDDHSAQLAICEAALACMKAALAGAK